MRRDCLGIEELAMNRKKLHSHGVGGVNKKHNM